MRKLAANLPVIVGLLVTVSFSADVPFLRALKTESTFGVWLVVLLPVAILLLISQLLLWWAWPRTRPWRTSSQR